MPLKKLKTISGDHLEIDDVHLSREDESLVYTGKTYPNQASANAFQGAFDVKRKRLAFSDLPVEHRIAVRALRNYLLTDWNNDEGSDATIINE